MLPNLRADIARCGRTRGERWREVFFNTGFWAVASYRTRRAIFQWRVPKPVRIAFSLFSMVLKVATEVVTGVEIPPTIDIGPGLYIAHTGTIVLNSSTILGSNCTLTTNVVIGHAGGGGRAGVPAIGERVYIGPGAVLIGPITVGDDALIAPGAVVTRSVEPRAVMAGNPARAISFRGSFSLIEYPGMDVDRARLEALQLSKQDPRNEDRRIQKGASCA